MKLRKTPTAVFVALMAAGAGAQAALVNGSALTIGTGSEFGMEVSPGFVLNTPITGLNGIVLGTVQPASGSHSGPPNGTESPNIDQAWLFFGNTGMHQSTAATNVLSASGDTATIDFSGWGVTWNGLANIPMGAGAWDGNPEGVAEVTCGVDCSNGDTYTLTYSGTVPDGDPSNFGGVRYSLTTTGTVSAVPIPAAAWLFGSAALGVAGLARRRKAEETAA